MKRIRLIGALAAALPLLASPVACGPAGAKAASETRPYVALSDDVPVQRHAVADRGALPSATVLERLQLALVRPAAKQAELDALTAAQQDPSSPQFHRWLAPHELSERFAPPGADVARVVAWLTANGLEVDDVAADGMSIAFTGTAGRIGRAFQTELHDVARRDGERHVANMSAPMVPAALAGIVGGVTLSDFFPRPALRPVGAVRRDGRTGQAEVTAPAPGFTAAADGSVYFAIAPQDLAVIYDINPARNGTAGIGGPLTGQGVTIILAEQTDIRAADWSTFRSVFGLSGYTGGSLSIIHPGSARTCRDPGYTADEGEAALDAEWSSAVAPAAPIVVASCSAGRSGFGVMTALQNLVGSGPTGAAISISYGGCESGNGASFQASWANLIEEAASEGSSVFVSSGDNTVAGCDDQNDLAAATGGLAVNGLATPVYDTAVGGTDFSDGIDGTVGRYWTLGNSAVDGSALSYIPEIPWDDSCASRLNAASVGVASPLVLCAEAGNGLLNVVGGSGGPSAIYAQPSWQSGVAGVPADGKRGIPDVAFFASDGFWQHFLVFCMSDANEGGAPCAYTNSNDLLANAAGGTSFAAPIMAGVQALVAQHKGGNQGNAAPRLYTLGAAEFASSPTLNACLSQTGPTALQACVFRPIGRGDNAAPCQAGTPNCYAAAGQSVGILSSTTTTETDAYPSGAGWSFATGLGSVDVTNLLRKY